jgi:hypothetical protein
VTGVHAVLVLEVTIADEYPGMVADVALAARDTLAGAQLPAGATLGTTCHLAVLDAADDVLAVFDRHRPHPRSGGAQS